MFNDLTPKSKANKNSKIIHWLKWVQKLLAKKGIATDIDSCAYGQTHLVSRAKPIGGGWMFYSQACSGCAVSKLGLTSLKNMDNKLPKGAPNCALLSGPLFSLTRVKNGTVFNLPFINEENLNLPVSGKLLPPSPKKLGETYTHRKIYHNGKIKPASIHALPIPPSYGSNPAAPITPPTAVGSGEIIFDNFTLTDSAVKFKDLSSDSFIWNEIKKQEIG